MTALSPDQIRALRAEHPKDRARDFAETHGISEAALVASDVGHGSTIAIEAHPNMLMPHIARLGEVMALTRNESCVIERVGTYEDFRPGAQAQIVLGPEIDLRLFGKHWVHAYALEAGDKRSIQVFDAAGDAVHKIHLREGSDVAAFHELVAALRLPEQSPHVAVTARAATEAPHADADKAEVLRQNWAEMTDTHQFLSMVSRLKMNRLGAYRIVGEPQATRLDNTAVTRLLEGVAAEAIPIMIFVGNRACIEIHSGTVSNIVPMGPWINVMDPRLNVHLRADQIAEVWLVDKPTRHGPIRSVEAFDAQGGLILQIFGSRKLGRMEDFYSVLATLERQAAEIVA